MFKLLFLCISLAILVFSVIVLNIAPAINKVSNYYIIEWDDWSNAACKYLSDQYDYIKKSASKDVKDQIKKEKNRCNRKQAMISLEYVVSNLNIILGFICAFSGFLLYKEIGNIGNDAKYFGLIGIGSGVIGFVLTLVYIIESGLVFNDIADIRKLKIDSDGAFLKWDENRYKCIYYDKDDEESIFLKYSDFGNKYLRYTKKVIYASEEKEYKYDPYNGCRITNTGGFNFAFCESLEDGSNIPRTYSNRREYYDASTNPMTSKGFCDKLFLIDDKTTNEYKILYDHWLTTIILSCFIMLLNIGLAIFGFLLFAQKGGSSGSVPVK